MRWQHVVGWALVAVQAALLGYLSQTVFFPMLIVLVAGFGTLTQWRIPLSREQAFLLSAAAAFFFLFKHRFAPHEFPFGALFIRTQVAFIIAQFLLTIEAAQFIIRREEDRLSPVLPALGAVALICIADVQVTSQQRIVTQIFAVSYALLWALFLWTCRKPMPVPSDGGDRPAYHRARKRRRLAAAGILGAIAVTAWGASLGLYEFEKTIEGWLVRMMSGTSGNTAVGFSRSARLGSLHHRKTEAEDQVVLWVYADRAPGYLRGSVFTTFDKNEWNFSYLSGTPLVSISDPPEGMRPLSERELLFSHPGLRAGPSKNWRYLECWLTEDQESAAFTPLGTTHLITAADRVGGLPFGMFLLTQFEESIPYTACLPEDQPPFSVNFGRRELWEQVPADYQGTLEALSEEIFANAQTVPEKIRAVERYFHENYGYHLGIEVPLGEDPLLYFLREKPPAHCEYFATAAALLLRRAGVPARYVTGFMAAEWNPSGGYWTARNRDAHAWVEAYDPSQGWVTVEATPAAGVPAANPPETRWAWWEAFQADWRRLRTFLAQGNGGRVRSLLTSSHLSRPLALLAGGFVLYVLLRLRSRWPSRKVSADLRDPNLIEMHKLLQRVDQQLKRYGLERDPGETLHQFAQRVRCWEDWSGGDSPLPPLGEHPRFAEQVAGWYDAYARFRYQGHWDLETRADLQSRLPNC